MFMRSALAAFDVVCEKYALGMLVPFAYNDARKDSFVNWPSAFNLAARAVFAVFLNDGDIGKLIRSDMKRRKHSAGMPWGRHVGRLPGQRTPSAVVGVRCRGSLCRQHLQMKLDPQPNQVINMNDAELQVAIAGIYPAGAAYQKAVLAFNRAERYVDAVLFAVHRVRAVTLRAAKIFRIGAPRSGDRPSVLAHR